VSFGVAVSHTREVVPAGLRDGVTEVIRHHIARPCVMVGDAARQTLRGGFLCLIGVSRTK
jgi:hypothetical protein